MSDEIQCSFKTKSNDLDASCKGRQFDKGWHLAKGDNLKITPDREFNLLTQSFIKGGISFGGFLEKLIVFASISLLIEI